VKCHHRAQSKSRSKYKGQRFGADLSQLPTDLATLKRGLKQIEDNLQPELADFSDEFDQLDQPGHLSVIPSDLGKEIARSLFTMNAMRHTTTAVNMSVAQRSQDLHTDRLDADIGGVLTYVKS
jgi:hypothetical protein